MKKLNTLKPGDRFVWDGKKWVFDSLQKFMGGTCAQCYLYPNSLSYTYLPLDKEVKPIIRVNLN